jgi:hypothetical protein
MNKSHIVWTGYGEAFQIVLKRPPHLLPIASVERSKHSSVRDGYRLLNIYFAVQITLQKPAKMLMLRSNEVEAIKVHHLVPGCNKVMNKHYLSV